MGSSKLTVIVNTRLDAAHPSYWRSDVVAMGRQDAQGVEVVTADIVDPHNAIRHDPARRAHAPIRAWNRRAQGRQRGGAERRAKLA